MTESYRSVTPPDDLRAQMDQLNRDLHSLDKRASTMEGMWASERERSEAAHKLMVAETGKQFDAMRSSWDLAFNKLREDFAALSKQMEASLTHMEERLEQRQEERLKDWAGEDERGHARTLSQAVKAEREDRRARFWNRVRLYGPIAGLVLFGVLTAVGEGSLVAGFRAVLEIFAWG